MKEVLTQYLPKLTAQLQNGREEDYQTQYAPTNLNGALWAAAARARVGRKHYVYSGVRLGHKVYRVTDNRSEAMNEKKNPGGCWYEINIDLAVFVHEVKNEISRRHQSRTVD